MILALGLTVSHTKCTTLFCTDHNCVERLIDAPKHDGLVTPWTMCVTQYDDSSFKPKIVQDGMNCCSEYVINRY